MWGARWNAYDSFTVSLKGDETKEVLAQLKVERNRMNELHNQRVRITIANIIEQDFSPIRELRFVKNAMDTMEHALERYMAEQIWLNFIFDFKTSYPPTQYGVWRAVTTIQKYWRLRGKHVRPRRAAEIDRVLGEVCDMPRDVTRLIGSY
jgi:hypothetical protein